MKRILLLTFLCFTIGTSWSQRSQIIAYMDMEYILENVPEYLEAQNTLDKKYLTKEIINIVIQINGKSFG